METPHRVLARAAALLSSALLLAACGGGGGDAPAAAPEQPAGTFNVEAGITALFAQGGTFQLAGKGPDYELSATETFAPGAPANRQIGDYFATQRSMTRIGSLPSTETGTYYYAVNPFRLAEIRFRTGVPYQYVPEGNLPAAALLGDSGAFATGAPPGGSSNTLVRWSLEASDVSATAWACLSFIARNSFEALCARIDAQGKVLGLRVREQIALGPVIDLH